MTDEDKWETLGRGVNALEKRARDNRHLIWINVILGFLVMVVLTVGLWQVHILARHADRNAILAQQAADASLSVERTAYIQCLTVNDYRANDLKLWEYVRNLDTPLSRELRKSGSGFLAFVQEHDKAKTCVPPPTRLSPQNGNLVLPATTISTTTSTTISTTTSLFPIVLPTSAPPITSTTPVTLPVGNGKPVTAEELLAAYQAFHDGTNPPGYIAPISTKQKSNSKLSSKKKITPVIITTTTTVKKKKHHK